MNDRKKNTMNIFLATSDANIDGDIYSFADTYESEKAIDSDIKAVYLTTKYGSLEEKTKRHTSSTRKQDELVNINEKLRKLKLYI